MEENEVIRPIFSVQIEPFGAPDEEGLESGKVTFDPSIWREHCSYTFGRGLKTAD